MVENIYFEHINKKTESYFLEYSPPVGSIPFASLNVTYVSDVTLERVATDLEVLSKEWISRYPVPIMASAFDKHGDLINLEGIRNNSNLTTILDNGMLRYRWELLEDDEFPEKLKDQGYLMKIYSDLSYRTQSEVSAKARENLKPMRTVKRLLIVWVIFVPLAIALLEFFSPIWISIIALAYSFWKAYQQWLKMTGQKQPTVKEEEKEKNDRLKEHHHYHCQLNPKGFLKLKTENFQKMEEDQIKQKYDSIPTEH